MSTVTNHRVRTLLKRFVTLPWHKHRWQWKDAPDEAYIMQDLGFHRDDFMEFLEEFQAEFELVYEHGLIPRDETIESLCRIAESKKWPETWRSDYGA